MPLRRVPIAAVAARVLLAPYLVVLGLIVFLPARDAGRVTGIVGWAADLLAGAGAPREASAVVLEFLANIVLFVPFGALVALAAPNLGVWPVVAAGFLLSTAIELIQLGIPSRVAAVSDVVANTAGTALGVFLVAAAVHARLPPAPPPEASADG